MSLGILLFALILGLGSSAGAASITDFDGFVAPDFYSDVVRGGPLGPSLSFSDIGFNGGVILSDAIWGGGVGSAPNLFATSDFALLDDGLPLGGGIISASLTNPSDSITIDVVRNGGPASASFTLFALDANATLVGMDTVVLDAMGLPGFFAPGSVGSLSVQSGSFDIASFYVVSSQAFGSKNFAIDDVSINPIPNPEPHAAAVFAAGLLVVARAFRRRPVPAV